VNTGSRVAGDRYPVRRGGFTLFELIVVMAVISVIAAMAAPAVLSRVRANAVAQGAESVRDILSRARTYAIDGGIDYQFRFEPSGRNFVVLPMELEPSDSNSTMPGDLASNYLRLSGELDEGFRLMPAASSLSAIESLEAAWFGQLDNALQLSQTNWSSPIIFRFDGTADDGQFRLVTDTKLAADVSVRGLTGAVAVSSVYPEAE